MPEIIDRVETNLTDVRALLTELSTVPHDAAYPFAKTLELLRVTRRGDLYLAQISGVPAAETLAIQYEAVKELLRSQPIRRQRDFYFTRWRAIQDEGEAGGPFPSATWRDRVREMNDHQELLDSEFVQPEDSAELLSGWASSFLQIEAVWKDQVTA